MLIEEPTYRSARLALREYLGARSGASRGEFEYGFQLDPREVERAHLPTHAADCYHQSAQPDWGAHA